MLLTQLEKNGYLQMELTLRDLRMIWQSIWVLTGGVACQSGTAGLHTALLVSAINRGDIVIVPTLTFIAAVNPVKYVGATPVFMDCDDSLCMDPVKLQMFCEEECDYYQGKLKDKKSGKIVKAIIVVHVFGNMADMESIMQIAHKYNLIVIEDATEALGTYYRRTDSDKKYFAGTIGDIGVYSFNGNKIITTGGGGMLVSGNKKFLDKARHLTTQAKSDTLYYIHDGIGYNYRMTNVQAAIGVAQLERLEEFISIKEKNYEIYKSEIEKMEKFKFLDFRSGCRCNHWFYSLYCLEDDRDDLMKYLLDNYIQNRPIWGLIHEQKPYRKNRAYRIEKANVYWRHVVNIPCSTTLVEDEIDYILKILKRWIYERYCKIR